MASAFASAAAEGAPDGAQSRPAIPKPGGPDAEAAGAINCTASAKLAR